MIKLYCSKCIFMDFVRINSNYSKILYMDNNECISLIRNIRKVQIYKTYHTPYLEIFDKQSYKKFINAYYGKILMKRD